MAKDKYLVTIPFWDRCKIYILSWIFGMWVIFTMLTKWLWDSNAFFNIKQRDSPPPCLVDSFLGQHKYVKLKGVKYHYVESGLPNQPLILLLHGFPDFWLSWRYQIPVLSEHFRVIALDLKGFGDSDKPTSRNVYRIEKIIDELKGLIKSLGVLKCIVIGHDIGALLGWYLTQQYPDIIEKLIMISCSHPNEFRKNFLWTWNYTWFNFVQLPYFPEINALKEDVKIIRDYHKHLSQNDNYLEAYKYAFSRKEDWSGALNYFRNFPYIEIVENSIINIPVIFITGNRDKYTKLESVIQSTEYCEKFNVKIIEGAEHFPHQEKPLIFNNILLKFLIKKIPKHKEINRESSKGFVNRMIGAVSNTVKYGNSVLDTVQKSGVVTIPSMGLLNYSVLNDKTDVK